MKMSGCIICLLEPVLAFFVNGSFTTNLFCAVIKILNAPLYD